MSSVCSCSLENIYSPCGLCFITTRKAHLAMHDWSYTSATPFHLTAFFCTVGTRAGMLWNLILSGICQTIANLQKAEEDDSKERMGQHVYVYHADIEEVGSRQLGNRGTSRDVWEMHLLLAPTGLQIQQELRAPATGRGASSAARQVSIGSLNSWLGKEKYNLPLLCWKIASPGIRKTVG